MIALLVLLLAFVLLKNQDTAPASGPTQAYGWSTATPAPASYATNPPIAPPSAPPVLPGVQPNGETCIYTPENPHACDAWNAARSAQGLHEFQAGQNAILSLVPGIGPVASKGLSAIENKVFMGEGPADRDFVVSGGVTSEDIAHSTTYYQTKYSAKRTGGGPVGGQILTPPRHA